MNHIQKWFERIAGITQEECERREFAQKLFGRQQFDTSALHKPACWRRKHVLGAAAVIR